MCVHDIVAHLRIHPCHVTATVLSLFVGFGVDVAVDYIKVFGVAAGREQWVGSFLTVGELQNIS